MLQAKTFTREKFGGMLLEEKHSSVQHSKKRQFQ